MSVSEKTWDYVIVGGGSAGCALANRLSADPGSYAVTGQAATLLYGRAVTADPGSIVLSGQSVGLTHHKTLTAAAGVFDTAMDGGTERFPVFYLHGGAVRLTSFTNSTTAVCSAVQDLSSTQTTARWGQSWGPFVGFPRSCTFHQNRLVLGISVMRNNDSFQVQTRFV